MSQGSVSISQEKSTGVAILLSLIITGAGQLYAGATERGLILLVIGFILGILSFSTGVFFIILIPYWIWGMFDANTQAENFNANIKKAATEHANKLAEAEELSRKTITSSEFVLQLEKISKLHGAGLLDDTEYPEKKKDLILSLLERKPREGAEDFLTALIPSIERKYLIDSEIMQIKKIVL